MFWRVHLKTGHVGSPCSESYSLVCSMVFVKAPWPYPDCTGDEKIWLYTTSAHHWVSPVRTSKTAARQGGLVLSGRSPGGGRYVIHYGTHLSLAVGRDNLGHVQSRLLMMKICLSCWRPGTALVLDDIFFFKWVPLVGILLSGWLTSFMALPPAVIQGEQLNCSVGPFLEGGFPWLISIFVYFCGEGQILRLLSLLVI